VSDPTTAYSASRVRSEPPTATHGSRTIRPSLHVEVVYAGDVPGHEFHAKKPLTWLAEVSKRLEQLAELPSNWNGRNAPPPTPRALQLAEIVKHELGDAGLRPDSVIATVDGGVVFYLRNGGRDADIEAGDDGTIGAIVSERATGFCEAWDVDVAEDGISKAVEKIRTLLGR
jgi:hypothetical protein